MYKNSFVMNKNSFLFHGFFRFKDYTIHKKTGGEENENGVSAHLGSRQTCRKNGRQASAKGF